MTEHPMVPFLRARWDEEEHAAKADLDTPDAEYWADKALNDIAAKRKILDAWADPFGNWSTEQAEAARAMKAHVLRLLAEPHRDHPDYPKDQP